MLTPLPIGLHSQTWCRPATLSINSHILWPCGP